MTRSFASTDEALQYALACIAQQQVQIRTLRVDNYATETVLNLLIATMLAGGVTCIGAAFITSRMPVPRSFARDA